MVSDIAASVNWTEVLLAFISTVGTIATGYFAYLTRRHERSAFESRKQAAVSAETAVQASMRPGFSPSAPPLSIIPPPPDSPTGSDE